MEQHSSNKRSYNTRTLLIITCVFILSLMLPFSLGLTTISPGVYSIGNVQDGLFLTIQGSNATFATVVGENWQNFKEQRWELRKLAGQSGLHFIPQKYNANNLMSYYRDPARKYPTPETWDLVEVVATPGKFQIQNTRTKLCLVTTGRRRIVTETKCDRHLRAQHWDLNKL